MGDIIRKRAGHAREHVLETLSGNEIAVAQRGLAEHGEQIVTRAIDLEIGGPPWLREWGRQVSRMMWRWDRLDDPPHHRAARGWHERRKVAAFIEVESQSRHRSPLCW